MAYKIPLFKLNFDHQEEEAVIETLKSKWISTGPKCEEFEKSFSLALNIDYALPLSSCTSALHLAMIILNIHPGDEVICPSLTFAATVNAIKYVGANPVFCDVCSTDNLNIDVDKIVELITPKTKAVVAVHYAGFPCEMDKLLNVARQHNLRVIEDASHAPLSEYKGKKLGTFGEVGCFSFFSNKNISTGEGGMLVTGDELLYNKARLLRSHGMTTMSYQRSIGHATEYDIVELGYNYRMDDIRASIGLVQLKKLPGDIASRSNVRDQYLRGLSRISGITIPFADHQETVSNYILPIVLKDSDKQQRDKLRENLADAGIQTSIHYPAIHLFTIYKEAKTFLPVTEYVSDNEISLPMFGSLKTDEVDYICNQLDYFIQNG